MASTGKGMTKCPKCGAPLKTENLERHLNAIHRLAADELDSILNSIRDPEGGKNAGGRGGRKGGVRKVDMVFAVVILVILAGSVTYIYYPGLFRKDKDGDDGPDDKAIKRYSEFVLTTPDGFELFVNYYAANESNAPLMILIHGMEEGRSVWEDMALALLDKGYHVLSYDLRGHGESVMQNGYKQDIPALEKEDFDEMVPDLAMIKDYVDQYKPYRGEVGIIGASLGANIALNYAVGETDVKSLVLLSPGLGYTVTTSKEKMVQYGNRSVLFAASEEDDIAAEGVYVLHKNAIGYKEKILLSGFNHGSWILKEEGMDERIISWMEETVPVAL